MDAHSANSHKQSSLEKVLASSRLFIRFLNVDTRATELIPNITDNKGESLEFPFFEDLGTELFGWDETLFSSGDAKRRESLECSRME